MGSGGYMKITALSRYLALIDVHDMKVKKKELEINKNELLIFEVTLGKKGFGFRLSFETFEDAKIQDGKMFCCMYYADMKIIDKYYHQSQLDLLMAWERGEMPDWKKLGKRKRQGWSLACGNWSGIGKMSKPNLNYIVDCNLVKQEDDLYCLLGEVFCGYRGYLGSNLNALNDSIGIFSEGFATSELGTVTFLNMDRLKQLPIVYKHDFAWYMKDFFTKEGFTVIEG